MLKKWGNARGNAFWEARAKEDDIPTVADRSINSRKLKNFIINKYQERKWAVKGMEPEDWLKKNPNTEPRQKGIKAPKNTRRKVKKKTKTKKARPVAKAPASTPSSVRAWCWDAWMGMRRYLI